MKRKFSTFFSNKSDGVYNFTRSKRRRIDSPNLSWVTPSNLRNYMLNDALVDVLELKESPKRSNQFSQLNLKSFLCKKGIEFESMIINELRKNHHVLTISNRIDEESIDSTIAAIRDRIPIIHSAPMKHDRLGIKGIADLLIRGDYIEKVVKNIYPPSNLNSYFVIDIKFSTLSLCSDGVHLLNSGSFPAYKAQLWIYNQCLGNIQGFTPNLAYVLGRRWRYIEKGKTYSGFNCLDRLGTVNFENKDIKYQEKVKEAINWYRDVDNDGRRWSIIPPYREELYPNMCVDSGKWNDRKREIAESIGEITQIWNCGIKHRTKAIENGITSWRDEKCNSKTLGIQGKRAKIVDSILCINRKENLILPKTIKTTLYDWRVEKEEMFVDFETEFDIFSTGLYQKKTDQIFMIGVLHRDRDSYEYKNFLCNELNKKEEIRIVKEFYNFAKGKRLWYWHAEKILWDRAITRTGLRFEKELDWCDLAKIFRKEPIVVKGCYNFSLKEIVKAMNRLGFIQTQLKSNCTSGTYAAIAAWEAYNASPIKKNEILSDISTYNEFDVTALYDIISFLRREL